MTGASRPQVPGNGGALQGLRILFLFGSLDLGGAERQGLEVADYLKGVCGARVEVWGLSEKPGRLSELCQERSIPWQGIRFHWGIRKGFSHFFEFLARLRANRPDVLISATCVPNLVCALMWKAAGARLCIWNQVDEGLLLHGGVLHRLAVRLPHCFISNSTGGRDFLSRTYGLPPGRITVIHNGIAPPKPIHGRDEWRRRLGVEPDATLACMVANLSRHKDHETLLHAWAGISPRPGRPRTELLLAGRFDGTEDRLSRLCEDLAIGDRVRFLGPVDDVDGLLGACDLFVYSSRSEGIPNAVLEAMAAGLPVVATDIPGIREAVGDDGRPFLAPAGDSAALADRIELLLDGAELRNSLGARLQRRAESHFSVEDMRRATAGTIIAALGEQTR